jgi:hypothetical protein
MKKIPNPTQTSKEKKARHLECLPIGCIKFLPKRVRHHFWPRLIPLVKNSPPILLAELFPTWGVLIGPAYIG